MVNSDRNKLAILLFFGVENEEYFLYVYNTGFINSTFTFHTGLIIVWIFLRMVDFTRESFLLASSLVLALKER